MKDFLSRLTSRKFLIVLGATVLVFLQSRHVITFSPQELEMLKVLGAAFIAAEGLADTVTRYTNIPSVDENPSTTESTSQSVS
jgi:hypothetical protein